MSIYGNKIATYNSSSEILPDNYFPERDLVGLLLRYPTDKLDLTFPPVTWIIPTYDFNVAAVGYDFDTSIIALDFDNEDPRT